MENIWKETGSQFAPFEERSEYIIVRSSTPVDWYLLVMRLIGPNELLKREYMWKFTSNDIYHQKSMLTTSDYWVIEKNVFASKVLPTSFEFAHDVSIPLEVLDILWNHPIYSYAVTKPNSPIDAFNDAFRNGGYMYLSTLEDCRLPVDCLKNIETLREELDIKMEAHRREIND